MPNKDSRRILIASSDKNCLLLIEDAFAKSSFRLIQTQSVDEAIKGVFNEVPHLVILDQNHAAKDQMGEVCIHIKRDVILGNIPILLLTSKTEEGKVVGAECGADYYLIKPFRPVELLSLCRRILRHAYDELDLNPLTNLPGNRSSMARIEGCFGHNRPFAICHINIDNFSSFNQAYGMIRGDEVITETAKILQKTLKEAGQKGDFLGHVGGDHFVIVTSPQRADRLCAKTIDRFDRFIPSLYDHRDRRRGYVVLKDKAGAVRHCPLLSLTISVVDNSHRRLTRFAQWSQLSSELIQQVKSLPGSHFIREGYLEDLSSERQGKEIDKHVAMIISDRNKRDTTDSQRVFLLRREKRIVELSRTIQNRELSVVFQPVVELSNRQIVGYEGLSRGPKGSELNDARILFEIAREVGMVQDLDFVCLDQIFLLSRELPEGLKLFVNMNRESIIDKKRIQAVFKREGSAVRLKDTVVEITEQGILKDFERIHTSVHDLKSEGFRFAIDDLGGGAVSLRDVARLKPDFIKFDISLTRQIDKSPTKQKILDSLVLFANSIGAKTISEGIEAAGEVEALINAGVSYGQGYYLARPQDHFIDKLTEIES